MLIVYFVGDLNIFVNCEEVFSLLVSKKLICFCGEVEE